MHAAQPRLVLCCNLTIQYYKVQLLQDLPRSPFTVHLKKLTPQNQTKTSSLSSIMATDAAQQDLLPAPKTPPPQPKTPPRTKPWLGCVRDGKLWCDCTPPERARCLTTTKPGRNKGRLCKSTQPTIRHPPDSTTKDHEQCGRWTLDIVAVLVALRSRELTRAETS